MNKEVADIELDEYSGKVRVGEGGVEGEREVVGSERKGNSKRSGASKVSMRGKE
ncbi:hypothetical protein [Staphylococcus capitis]|uniref:hypothetical protein n=1 Tax=Staphylococcus capitis TaxID=29388 RepID=UPI001642D43B|nr:hypothetical protein [Staphylococcus capitis]